MVHQPRNPQSPRGWRNNDAGGVGLGIAVALEKAGGGIGPMKLHSTAAPIAITSPRTSPGTKGCPEIYGLSCCDSPPAHVAGESYVADFLRNCFVCKKNLHGKDIFMYREKAFCSAECRYQQMMSDEYQERYGARSMKRSPEIASSPCAAGGQLFFTAGIQVS